MTSTRFPPVPDHLALHVRIFDLWGGHPFPKELAAAVREQPRCVGRSHIDGHSLYLVWNRPHPRLVCLHVDSALI